MIKVEHLTKCYGDFTAVDDLSFEIDEGHVYGFLGPNGAGKSTTMNIITGCLSATDGHVTIDGHDIFDEPKEAKRLIGYLPEQPPLYMNETPLDYLRFVGEAKGLKGAELKKQIEEVIQKTGLDKMRTRRISALSKGYKQRVGIAQALLGNPRVIILDEPTVGLDPIQLLEIRDLIMELGKTHTVIFSSHILSEVQTLCDRLIIIAHGKLLANDTPDVLKDNLSISGEITLLSDASEKALHETLTGIEHIKDITFEKHEVGVKALIQTDHEAIYEITRAIHYAMAEAKLAILAMTPKQVTLEDLFLELTEQPAAENTAESEVEEA